MSQIAGNGSYVLDESESSRFVIPPSHSPLDNNLGWHLHLAPSPNSCNSTSRCTSTAVVDLMAKKDAHIKEQWVKTMEIRLVRDELNKCYKGEGVNATEHCKDLALRYLGMLKSHKVSPLAITANRTGWDAHLAYRWRVSGRSRRRRRLHTYSRFRYSMGCIIEQDPPCRVSQLPKMTIAGKAQGSGIAGQVDKPTTLPLRHGFLHCPQCSSVGGDWNF